MDSEVSLACPSRSRALCKPVLQSSVATAGGIGPSQDNMPDARPRFSRTHYLLAEWEKECGRD